MKIRLLLCGRSVDSVFRSVDWQKGGTHKLSLMCPPVEATITRQGGPLRLLIANLEPSLVPACDTKIFICSSRETHSIVARVARGVGNGTFTIPLHSQPARFRGGPPELEFPATPVGAFRITRRSTAYLDDRDELLR